MMVVSRGVLAAFLTTALLVPATAGAQQPSKSAAVAKDLTAALDAAKLDSLAAADPANEGVFFGTLYFPGLQLLVVSAKYAVPVLLTQRIAKKEYRDVYLDLNSASEPSTKIFIEDLGADGLVARPDRDAPADVYEVAGKRVVFDRDWRAQDMSEDDYMKAFADADARYAEMLSALLAEAKRTN
jgi:hypothetical protein